MKATIGSVILVVYLGIGLIKGWQQEVYLFLGILGLVFFNSFITAEFVQTIEKKLDELVRK
jgi:hypothetical protein